MSSAERVLSVVRTVLDCCYDSFEPLHCATPAPLVLALRRAYGRLLEVLPTEDPFRQQFFEQFESDFLTKSHNLGHTLSQLRWWRATLEELIVSGESDSAPLKRCRLPVVTLCELPGQYAATFAHPRPELHALVLQRETLRSVKLSTDESHARRAVQFVTDSGTCVPLEASLPALILLCGLSFQKAQKVDESKSTQGRRYIIRVALRLSHLDDGV